MDTVQVEIERVRLDSSLHVADALAVEEPLEIRIEYGSGEERSKKTISITMRTPGQDYELAAGFLFTEGILKSPKDIENIKFCGPSKNVVRVEFKPHVIFDLARLQRHFYTSSSCGVCGKTSIEALKVQRAEYLNPHAQDLKISREIINEMPRRLRETQGLFSSTGGLHGCAIFDSSGNLLFSREDVGRHNALDKLIGYHFLNDKLPLDEKLLLVSGRASFELIQKASMAGIKFFAAVGAPSSLALELAKETNMTLLGFVRDERFNIYNGASRVQI